MIVLAPQLQETRFGGSPFASAGLSASLSRKRGWQHLQMFLPHSCYRDPVTQHGNASETSVFHVNVTTVIPVVRGCHKGHMEKNLNVVRIRK